MHRLLTAGSQARKSAAHGGQPSTQVGCSRRAADHDDHWHGVQAMAASALLRVDDHDPCAILSDILSDLGYRVDVAYDGPTALEQSRWHPYGLALLDYKMPGTDDLELYGHRKQVRADTLGVLVTAFAADATIQEPHTAGTAVAPDSHAYGAFQQPTAHFLLHGGMTCWF